MIRRLALCCLLFQSTAFSQTFQEYCEKAAELPPAQQAFIKSVLERKYATCSTLQQSINDYPHLTLSSEGLTDISLMASIKGIKELSLNRNSISDVSSLAHLDTLEVLDIESNDIKDVSPLAALKKLHTLDIGDNKLVTLESIRPLKSLQRLYLEDNTVVDYEPLAGLTSLTHLRVGNGFWRNPSRCREQDSRSAKNTDPAASLERVIPGLTHLEFFWSNGINFASTKSFEKLLKLKNLGIECASIAETDVLASLPLLENLTLSHNRLSRIAPPPSARAIKGLYLAHNFLANTDILDSISDAIRIDMSNNALSGEFKLRSMKSLRSLSLDGNTIKYLDLQGGFPSLSTLELSNNALKHVFFENKNRKLRYVSLANNHLQNPQAGIELSGVTDLDVSHNHIQDFSFINAIDIGERERGLELEVGGNTSSDFRVINNPRIRSFSVRGSNLNDLADLPDFKYLTRLDISDNNFTTLKGIDLKYKHLNHLVVENNPLSSSEGLENLEDLNNLNLSHTKIGSMQFLSNLKYLSSLKVSGNSIASLDFIRTLDRLYSLDASDNSISDLTLLDRPGRRIMFLKLDRNLITDVTPLSELEGLDSAGSLSLNRNPLGTTVAKTPENCPTQSASSALNAWCSRK